MRRNNLRSRFIRSRLRTRGSASIRRIEPLPHAEDTMLQSLLSLAFIGHFTAPRGTVPGLSNWRRRGHLRLV